MFSASGEAVGDAVGLTISEPGEGVSASEPFHDHSPMAPLGQHWWVEGRIELSWSPLIVKQIANTHRIGECRYSLCRVASWVRYQRIGSVRKNFTAAQKAPVIRRVNGKADGSFRQHCSILHSELKPDDSPLNGS